MDKKFVIQPWFYIDHKEFPNLLPGLPHVPRIGERISFPDHFANRQFIVNEVVHSLREKKDSIIQDIHIYAASK